MARKSRKARELDIADRITVELDLVRKVRTATMVEATWESADGGLSVTREYNVEDGIPDVDRPSEDVAVEDAVRGQSAQGK